MILKIIDAIQYLSYSALTSKANSKFIEGVGGKPTKLLLPPHPRPVADAHTVRNVILM